MAQRPDHGTMAVVPSAQKPWSTAEIAETPQYHDHLWSGGAPTMARAPQLKSPRFGVPGIPTSPVDLASVALRGPESMGSSRVGRLHRGRWTGETVPAQQKPPHHGCGGCRRKTFRTSPRRSGQFPPRETQGPSAYVRRHRTHRAPYRRACSRGRVNGDTGKDGLALLTVAYRPFLITGLHLDERVTGPLTFGGVFTT